MFEDEAGSTFVLQGYRQQALVVTLDSEHKFELALQLGNLSVCYELAVELENEQKWIQLSEVATKLGEFALVQECLIRAQSFGSLLLLASASSDQQLMSSIGDQSRKSGQFNIAFLSNFVLGKLESCLEILIENQRLPEAAFFTRTYLPSQTSRVIDLWREKLKSVNMERAAQSLANPVDYENLFPGLVQTYKTEQFLKQENERRPARDYSNVQPNWERKPVEEMLAAENEGRFTYEPVRSIENDDEENFDDASDTPSRDDLPRPTLNLPFDDRSATQSPMNSSVSSFSTKFNRESSKAASIRSTSATIGSVRPASVSDLEKELEDLDIDLDTDDVRNAKNGSAETKGVFQKVSDENEVNSFSSHCTFACPFTNTLTNTHAFLLRFVTIEFILNLFSFSFFRKPNWAMTRSMKFSRIINIRLLDRSGTVVLHYSL